MIRVDTPSQMKTPRRGRRSPVNKAPYSHDALVAWMTYQNQVHKRLVTRKKFSVDLEPTNAYLQRSAEHSVFADNLLVIIEKQPYLRIAGAKGSGKEALIHWLTCELSSKEPTVAKNFLHNRIPFPVFAQELPMEKLVYKRPSWYTLLEASIWDPDADIVGDFRDKPILPEKDVLEELLRTGRMALLVDGVGEFINRRYQNWILEAIETAIVTNTRHVLDTGEEPMMAIITLTIRLSRNNVLNNLPLVYLQ